MDTIFTEEWKQVCGTCTTIIIDIGVGTVVIGNKVLIDIHVISTECKSSAEDDTMLELLKVVK